MKIYISDETRDLFSTFLAKIDDRILEKAISVTKPNEDGVKVIEPYILDRIVQKLIEYLRNMEV